MSPPTAIAEVARGLIQPSVRRRARPGPLVPLVLIGLLLAGCDAASSGGSTAHTDSGMSSQPSARPDDTPRNDLNRESVVPWSRYEQVSGNQLRFFYTGGDRACYGVRTEQRRRPGAAVEPALSRAALATRGAQ